MSLLRDIPRLDRNDLIRSFKKFKATSYHPEAKAHWQAEIDKLERLNAEDEQWRNECPWAKYTLINNSPVA